MRLQSLPETMIAVHPLSQTILKVLHEPPFIEALPHTAPLAPSHSALQLPVNILQMPLKVEVLRPRSALAQPTHNLAARLDRLLVMCRHEVFPHP